MFIKYIFSILNTADEIFVGSKMSIHFRPTCKQISGEFRHPKVVNPKNFLGTARVVSEGMGSIKDYLKCPRYYV